MTSRFSSNKKNVTALVEATPKKPTAKVDTFLLLLYSFDSVIMVSSKSCHIKCGIVPFVNFINNIQKINI